MWCVRSSHRIWKAARDHQHCGPSVSEALPESARFRSSAFVREGARNNSAPRSARGLGAAVILRPRRRSPQTRAEILVVAAASAAAIPWSRRFPLAKPGAALFDAPSRVAVGRILASVLLQQSAGVFIAQYDDGFTPRRNSAPDESPLRTSCARYPESSPPAPALRAPCRRRG